MKRSLCVCLAAAALVPSLGLASPLQTQTSARVYSDPATPGPYGVGVVNVQVRARHHPREPLNTFIWYPAETNGAGAPYVYLDDEALGSLSLNAVEGAPLVRGPEPYPIIAFSHGNGGIAYQSVFLTEHLASHGYVVISADHPGNTLFDYEVTSLATGLVTRPLDISALLDELDHLNKAADSMFRGQLDLDKIGMTGHSFGGYTTLAVGGARLNFNTSARDCAVTADPTSCRVVGEAQRWGGIDDGFLDLSDPRVSAIAPLAPWAWEPFRAEGLAFMDLPVQAHGGDLDDTCPYLTQVLPVYENATGPRSILDFYAAGHYAWSDFCWIEPDYKECAPPYIDMDDVHALINTWVTSHFKVFLDGDSRYEIYLSAEYAAQFAELLQWQQALDLQEPTQ